jgi:hypothetical protein
MADDTDEHIGAALAAAHGRISDQVRAENDRALRALVDALSRGRWGAFWCRFREPTAALRRLADLAPAAVPHLLQWPDAARLVGRLVEVVTEMAVVVVAGERASSEKQMHALRELLEAKDDYIRLTVHELR